MVTEKCVNELLPIITKIVNLSFINGKFPDDLKSALITPLIIKNRSWIEKYLKITALSPTYHFSDNAISQATIFVVKDSQLTNYVADKWP